MITRFAPFARVGALFKTSLRAQLALGVALLVAVLIVLVVFDLVERENAFLLREETNQAVGLTRNLAAAGAVPALSANPGGLQDVVKSFAQVPEVDYLMLVSGEGRVLAHSDAQRVGAVIDDENLRELRAGPAESRVMRRGARRIDVAAPVLAGERVIGWAQVGFNLEQVRQETRATLYSGLLYALFGVLVGTALAVGFAGVVTRRLRRLLDAMSRIRAGEAAARAAVDRGDEIGALGEGLNAMVDALAQSEQRWRSIATRVPGMVFELVSRPHGGDFTYVSAGVLELCGRQPEEMLELDDLAAVLHPDDREKFLHWFRFSASTLEPINWEGRLLVGRATKWVNVRAAARHNDEGRVAWDGVVLNISESRYATEALRRSRDEVRELTHHQEALREQEKATIAREIHDELGATLTALKMDAYWLERRLAQAGGEYAAKLKQMQELLNQAVQATRRISTELRPRVLDDLGVAAGIEWLAGEFERRFGVDCAFTASPAHIELDGERAIALFRIAQESLTNIAKHAGATAVSVELKEEGDNIVLRIADNGRGLGAAARAEKPFSHGLRGMLERAHQIGGSLTLGGGPHGGTLVAVAIPRHDARIMQKH